MEGGTERVSHGILSGNTLRIRQWATHMDVWVCIGCQSLHSAVGNSPAASSLQSLTPSVDVNRLVASQVAVDQIPGFKEPHARGRMTTGDKTVSETIRLIPRSC